MGGIRIVASAWPVIGHEWAVDLLDRAISRGRIAHAYLFTGPAETGKTHLARVAAAALNCQGDSRPCGECRACVRTLRGQHPDVTVLEPEAGRVKIDQIRALRRDVALSPLEGRWRVYIVSDLHTATIEAENALLKTLEEPPSRVVLLITATDASLLLPTIVSRCQVLALRTVSVTTIERALLARGIEVDVAGLLARLSAGRVGWALRAADDPTVLADRSQRLDELLDVMGGTRATKIQAAERLGQRDDLADIARLWQTFWRDVLLIQEGLEDAVVNADRLEAARAVARQWDLRDTAAAARAVEATLERLNQNVNARLALEALFLGWRPITLPV